MLFIPQKTYLTDGTLREQLARLVAYSQAAAALRESREVHEQRLARRKARLGAEKEAQATRLAKHIAFINSQLADMDVHAHRLTKLQQDIGALPGAHHGLIPQLDLPTLYVNSSFGSVAFPWSAPHPLNPPSTPRHFGQPIVQPGDSGANNDRKIMPQFNATSNEKKAIYGRAPQELGNINDSDFDLCDAPDMGGVFGLWSGIANQQSNPYFSIGGVAKGVTVQQYFEQYFKNSGTH